MGGDGSVVKATDCKFKSRQLQIVGFLGKSIKLLSCIPSPLYIALVKTISQMSKCKHVICEGKVDKQKCISDVGELDKEFSVIELGASKNG